MLKKTIVYAFLLLLLPSGALAASEITLDGNDWTFYAYGNAFVIVQILTAITRIVTSAGFLDVTMGLALAGFILSGVTGLLRGQGTKIAGYFTGLIISIYMLFSVTVDIYVEEMVLNAESVAGAGHYGELVEGVPAAVGLPVALVSELGMWVTDALETNFVDPKGMGVPLMSEGVPFGSSAGMVRDLNNVKIKDPDLRHNFYQYFRDCSMPKIANGEISGETLVNSTDIWTDIQVNSPSIFTSFRGVSAYNGVMSCEDATTHISDRLAVINPTLIDQVVGGSGSLLALADASTVNTLLTFSVADAAADATASAAQVGLIDLFKGAHRYAAMATGSNEVMMSLNIEHARRSQKGGWYATAILFQDMAGYFYAILQAFVVGLAPVIVMIMLLPGIGAKVASSYGKVLIWLMLWAPGLAITNFILVTNYQAQMSNVWDGVNGGPAMAGGINLANQGLISAYTDNMLMACAFMSTLVPTIMWGIISGAGMVFASALDRASGANYAAQGAGAAMAGNANLGEQRINNTSMNNNVTTERNGAGYDTSTFGHGAGASVSHEQLSGVKLSVADQGQQSNTAVSATSAKGISAAEVKQASTEYATATQAVSSEIVSDTTAYAQQNGHMKNGSIDWNSMVQTEEGRQYAAAVSAQSEVVNQDAELHKQSEINERVTSMNAGINIAGIAGGKMPVKAGADLMKHQKEAESEETTSQLSNKEGQAQSVSVGETGKTVEGTGRSDRSTEMFSDAEQAQALASVVDSDLLSTQNSASERYSEAISLQDKAEIKDSASHQTVIAKDFSRHDYDNTISRSNELEGSTKDVIDQRASQVDLKGSNVIDETKDNLNDTRQNIEDGGQGIKGAAGAVVATSQAGVSRQNEASQEGPGVEAFDRRQIQELDNANAKAIDKGLYDEDGSMRDYQEIRENPRELANVAAISHDGQLYTFSGVYQGEREVKEPLTDQELAERQQEIASYQASDVPPPPLPNDYLENKTTVQGTNEIDGENVAGRPVYESVTVSEAGEREVASYVVVGGDFVRLDSQNTQQNDPDNAVEDVFVSSSISGASFDYTGDGDGVFKVGK